MALYIPSEIHTHVSLLLEAGEHDEQQYPIPFSGGART